MIRDTSQRRAIRRTFERAGRPLRPEEALESARRDVPSLGLATVYRTLKSLVEEGWLVTLDVPGKTACYEPASLPHHHHFHCRACDRVFDVDGCAVKQEALSHPEFQVESHELILHGLCDGCLATT